MQFTQTWHAHKYHIRDKITNKSLQLYNNKSNNEMYLMVF